jgi:hypothetical protein
MDGLESRFAGKSGGGSSPALLASIEARRAKQATARMLNLEDFLIGPWVGFCSADSRPII